MALTIDRAHTALLVMDFENDVVHEDGAFKDFGFAAMVKQNDVFGKTAKLLDATRRSGVKVIYVSVKFRSGYPERPANSGQAHLSRARGALRYTKPSPHGTEKQ